MRFMKAGLLCATTLTALSFWLISGDTDAISSEDRQAIVEVRDLIRQMKDDCKNMTLADFHLENDPPHLRDFSRQLAEECIAGK
ncbi:TPA: hypothetical protein P3R71_003785 [Klebsiella pneumoniae]|uniref:hypothetical protein n=1 Tax=Klebsiella pneumoniae TaxID=573 RepID=UPI0024A999E2|nr:hypothetical protein [Klebsiella pneumoniae]HDO7154559.1 hypothetical protein [Klebsiella pneumoniae]